jgi:signal peptidase I
MFRELRDVFKLMNHKDSSQNFKREIKLFDRVVVRLTDLYNNEGKLPRGWNNENINVSILSDKEGGNYEQM